MMGAVAIVAGLTACDQRSGPAVPATPATAIDATAADWNGAGIAWLKADDGLRLAETQKKPVVVVVSTTWCGHCRNYKQEFFDPRVVAAAHDFVMIHVDSDKSPELGRRFAPDGEYIPRTLFLSSAGALANAIALPRPNYRHFYDEHDPAGLLAAMTEAKRLQ